MTHSRILTVVTGLWGLTLPLRAQTPGAPQVNGSVRAGYWSSTRNLDRAEPLGSAMAWLKATAPLADGLTVFAEGWAALRGPVNAGDAAAELREAYVAASSGSVDLRVGRQIIAWGRADGINPTGMLTAEDLALLTPDDVDRRLGVSAATLRYFVGGLSITGLWIPEFRGHRFPLPHGSGWSFDEALRDWPGDQWAARAEHSGGAVDWSMTVFRGLDPSPDLSPGRAPDRVLVHHGRVQVYGADAATTVGSYGLRAEGAYVRTGDVAGANAFVRNPYVFVVIGGDRTFSGRLNVNVQYLGRRVIRWSPLSSEAPPREAALAVQQAVLSQQTRRTQHGATIRASYKWLQETLEAEWAAVAYTGPRGVALRPKATYAVNDHLTVLAGAEVFRGDEASLFGLLRPNSTAFLELRWGF